MTSKAPFIGISNEASAALYMAAAKGDESELRLLLDKDAGVNDRNEYGETALHRAVCTGNEKAVQLLLEKGADVNVQNNNGETVLHLAVSKGNQKAVQLLLDKSANVNVQNNNGQTALHIAASKGHEKVVQVLLDKGADINSMGGVHETAIQAADSKGHERVVRLLFSRGTQYAGTFHEAAFKGRKDVVQSFIASGTDVNVQDGKYGTALQAAAAGDHEEVVCLLLENRADVNAEGGRYGYALFAAASRGNEAIVRLLIKNGANIRAESTKRTALYRTVFQAAAGRNSVLTLLHKEARKADSRSEPHGDASNVEISSSTGTLLSAEIALDTKDPLQFEGSKFAPEATGTLTDTASTDPENTDMTRPIGVPTDSTAIDFAGTLNDAPTTDVVKTGPLTITGVAESSTSGAPDATEAAVDTTATDPANTDVQPSMGDSVESVSEPGSLTKADVLPDKGGSSFRAHSMEITEGEDRLSLIEKGQGLVQSFFDTPINWYPMRSPRPPLKEGHVRISWPCESCSYRFFVQIPIKNAEELLSRHESKIQDDGNIIKVEEMEGQLLHFSHDPWMGTVSKGSTSENDLFNESHNSNTAGGEQNSVSSEEDQLTTASGHKGKPNSKGISPPESKVSNRTNDYILNMPAGDSKEYVLICMPGYAFPLHLKDAIDGPKKDKDFYNELREKYESIRGRFSNKDVTRFEFVQFYACDEFKDSALIACTEPDESKIGKYKVPQIYERMFHAYKQKCLNNTSTTHYDLMPKEEACDVKNGIGVKFVEGYSFPFYLYRWVLFLLVLAGGIFTIVWSALERAKGKDLLTYIQSTSLPFLIAVALVTFLNMLIS